MHARWRVHQHQAARRTGSAAAVSQAPPRLGYKQGRGRPRHPRAARAWDAVERVELAAVPDGGGAEGVCGRGRQAGRRLACWAVGALPAACCDDQVRPARVLQPPLLLLCQLPLPLLLTLLLAAHLPRPARPRPTLPAAAHLPGWGQPPPTAAPLPPQRGPPARPRSARSAPAHPAGPGWRRTAGGSGGGRRF